MSRRIAVPHPVERSEALERLARMGDPSAFMIVFGEQLHQTFLRLGPGAAPSTGTPVEPTKLLVAFGKKVYGEFQRSSGRTASAEWYCAREKQYLRIYMASSEIQGGGAVAGDEMFDRVRSFLALALQREFGRSRERTKSASGLTGRAMGIFRSPAVLIPALLVACIAIAVLALQILWEFSGTVMTIEISRPQARQLFKFPIELPARIAEFLPVHKGSVSHDPLAARRTVGVRTAVLSLAGDSLVGHVIGAAPGPKVTLSKQTVLPAALHPTTPVAQTSPAGAATSKPEAAIGIPGQAVVPVSAALVSTVAQQPVAPVGTQPAEHQGLPSQ